MPNTAIVSAATPSNANRYTFSNTSDQNSNMISDGSKGIIEIKYNHLNILLHPRQ
ncbi:MAG: hypothetical protein SH818_07735 [Saprospiraceae bacterium]|nr:hypothetical protein [Saprospiraceae bacterium]